MSLEPVKYFASLLVSAALIAAPLPAEAGGMSHGTSYGHTTMPSCKNKPSYSHNVNVYKPVTINKNIDVNKNLNINNNINVNKNLNINNNININKNINDNKNININKNINDNKNININKNIVINNGGSSDATAIAAAVAEASANSSSNASVNFLGGVSTGGGSGIPESPGPYAGGDLGAIAVDVAEHPQCVFQDSTVVKAIHAVCVSANGHEFPASHMVGQTWIESSYEGEIARCIPGAHLKVIIGEVVQSSQGMASSYSNGQVLECAPHEAVRHYKDGLLKCAPAMPVPDCTERTNLRKYGTGDMFFSYRAKVCVQTHQEFSESDNSQHAESREDSQAN